MHAGFCTAMLVILSAMDAHAEDLRTLGEKSGYRDTGRYEEVLRLCPAFAARFPHGARCFEFGKTPEGRPMMALAASADGTLDPAAVQRQRRPVVLILGGIHSGEIDGKDAGFALLRASLAKPDPALAAVTVVFVPVYNIDGHERFGPNQRPNQRGPREGGFRTTAQNLNLNRDFMKAEAPETRALLALMEAWDPVLLVDLHVTDGAKFEHDVAVLVSPEETAPLQPAARSLSDALMKRLAAAHHLPLPFYPSFRTDDDPTSGVDAAPPSPRYSHRYASARNRLGILVETHSWRDYAHRVSTTIDVVRAILDEATVHAAEWRKTALAADDDHLGGTDVVLSWKTVPPGHVFDFRGYAYTREKSDLTGGMWTRYDESKPQIWKMEVLDHLAPAIGVRAPAVGYLVPAAEAELVAAKLKAHGLRYQPLTHAVAKAATSTFRAESVVYGNVPFEGRFTATVTGAWKPEPRDLPAGSLFVPIAQPRAPLLMQLLEPTGPDSLVTWGFFNAAFEIKEYMENYVAEEEARKMLAHDPKLRAEFDAAVAKDPTMDAKKRLRFFYRRHPAWDERVNLVPIYHLDRPLTAR